MSERDEFEACPYCGDYGAEVGDSSVLSIFGGFKKAVFCNSCFAEGPTAESVTDAVAAWNRRATQAVPALTEPVAWGLRIGDSDVWSYTTTEADADFWGKGSGLRYEKRPLYAAPQVPALTDEQIIDLHDSLFPHPCPADSRSNVVKFARAILAAPQLSQEETK